MKMFWKVLGAAVLAVGLTPYRVEKDRETGEKRYQALLWYGTKNSRDSEKNLDIHLGFKKPNAIEDEPHLFSDELCVEYTGAPVTEEPAPEVPAAEDAPAAEEVPAESEGAAAEEAPAEIPEEGNTGEA